MPTKKKNSHETIAKVLVLYTGGTIGMVLDPNNPDAGLAPAKNGEFSKSCELNPSLNDAKLRKQLISEDEITTMFLVLPPTESTGKQDARVAYQVVEYPKLIDSSNMTVKHWQKICKDIRNNYENYDGFVVLHGTDTMAYTASALSFMLINLHKPVIITGAQKPIFDTRTDGPNNFISSILIAGLKAVPGVSVFFFDRLLRGNRCTKIDSGEFFGFDSYNLPPLMKFGVLIHIKNSLIPKVPKEAFQVHLGMNENVSLLRFFPGIPSRTVQLALDEPYQGIVLQTYGAGNIPTDRKDLIEAIKGAVKRGAVVINCTQCPNGTVAGIYETGKILTKIGVLSGFDMTIEAAITKLMFVLSMKRASLAYKKRLMNTVICGEMTKPGMNEGTSIKNKCKGKPISASKSSGSLKTENGNREVEKRPKSKQGDQDIKQHIS